jgi:nitroimidazol reductase NimA-like FMN-containing flavoprotein (pyridoxamine 5'-phosphate oxidase superfamily)
MFPEMRRIKQEISEEEAIDVLKSCSAGVLAVTAENGYPYTVPMNYAFAENRLIFHCATEGYKLDCIRRNDRVSFCVIDQNEIVPEKFSTIFRSVVVFGRVKILTGDAEKQEALEEINAKYSPGLETEGKKEIERNWNRTVLFVVEIDHMTGKIDLQTMIERARIAREAAGETCPGKPD